MTARREALQGVRVQKTTHPGLWLERYLEHQTNDPRLGRKEQQTAAAEARAKLLQELETIAPPAGYAQAFEYRKRDFDRPGVATATTKANGRLVIGLGHKGAFEAGLTLEHTWGVPVLPGSALKGLAAAAGHLLAADERWCKQMPRAGDVAAQPNAHDWLFGDRDGSGLVVFHDAWWIPGTGKGEKGKLPIHHDVMTVHHADYYQGKDAPPSDMDSPNPVPFASVSGSYLIALEGQEQWTDAAMQLLKLGLEQLGIGAKTNAGYGRMTLEYESAAAKLAKKEAERAQRQQRIKVEADRVDPGNAAQRVPELFRTFDEALHAELADALLKRLTPKWLRQRREIPWVEMVFAKSTSGS